MKVLHFSIFIILVGIVIIPNALADHDADKQWGTISVDKPTLEIAYTSATNSQYEKIKIYGTVEEPRSSGFIYMTVTEPDGKTYGSKVKPNGTYGNYENFVLVCCNEIGTYSVHAEWRGYHIGTVSFDVIQKTKSEQAPTITAESIIVIPDWIKTHAGWWTKGMIDDSAYILGIQYLIKEEIMIVPTTNPADYTGHKQVPGWIKNNAGWWAGGQIDDTTYVSGIQHLVKVGIIEVG